MAEGGLLSAVSIPWLVTRARAARAPGGARSSGPHRARDNDSRQLRVWRSGTRRRGVVHIRPRGHRSRANGRWPGRRRTQPSEAEGRERPWPRARRIHPVPSRTRSCPVAAPESTAGATLWEARPSRALPTPGFRGRRSRRRIRLVASRGGAAAARWAHNPKVGGSNPPPATTTRRTPPRSNPRRRRRLTRWTTH